MKRIAIIALVLVILATATTASVMHYDKYKTQKDAETTQAQAREVAEDKRLETAEARVVDLVAKHNTVRVECEKGVASYDLLTPFNKTKNPRPTCGPVITK